MNRPSLSHHQNEMATPKNKTKDRLFLKSNIDGVGGHLISSSNGWLTAIGHLDEKSGFQGRGAKIGLKMNILINTTI